MLCRALSNARSVIAISSKRLYRTLLMTGSPLGTKSQGLTIVATLVSMQSNLIKISRGCVSSLTDGMVDDVLDALVIVDGATPCELRAVGRRAVVCILNTKCHKHLVALLLVKGSKIEA